MLRRSITAATFFIALASAPASVCEQTAPQQNSPQAKKQTPATRTSAKTAKRTKKPKQQEVNIIPPPPPPPPTPEQMPSVAPEVAYRGGLLSINAPNSTMNDVLSAVRRVTGATIEKPPVGGTDRVVARLGPGLPKDVLESLFRGSRYDYIILGSMVKPGGVDRIILSARANGGPATAVATNTNPGQPPKPNIQPQQSGEQEEPDTDTEDMTVPERDQAEPEQPQPDVQQQPQGVPQGMPAQPTQEQPQQGQNPDQGQQPRVKSPDELLRELQQMQKQPPDQNQQQQEQPPPQ
jgi:hypothetical protein